MCWQLFSLIDQMREEAKFLEDKLSQTEESLRNQQAMANSLFIELERCRAEKTEYVKRFGSLIRDHLNLDIKAQPVS